MGDHDYCRALLKLTMEEVREKVSPELIKEAWTYKYNDGCIEFQIDSVKFYWYGQADCCWHARTKAWNAYLSEHHSEEKEDASASSERDLSDYKDPLKEALKRLNEAKI